MSVEIAWKQNNLVTDFHLLKLLQVVFGLGLQTFVCDFSRQNICSAYHPNQLFNQTFQFCLFLLDYQIGCNEKFNDVKQHWINVIRKLFFVHIDVSDSYSGYSCQCLLPISPDKSNETKCIYQSHICHPGNSCHCLLYCDFLHSYTHNVFWNSKSHNVHNINNSCGIWWGFPTTHVSYDIIDQTLHDISKIK